MRQGSKRGNKLFIGSCNGCREFTHARDKGQAFNNFRTRMLELFGRYNIKDIKEVQRTLPMVPENKQIISKLN